MKPQKRAVKRKFKIGQLLQFKPAYDGAELSAQSYVYFLCYIDGMGSHCMVVDQNSRIWIMYDAKDFVLAKRSRS